MTNARFFNDSQRLQLFMKSEGKCQDCGKDISLGEFHADHIIPFSLGGKTELSNGQALCSTCNLKILTNAC
jgi:5-methylcytosine-specific restriction endonuclease McrA